LANCPTATCKIAIPAILVSYSATVQAGSSASEINAERAAESTATTAHTETSTAKLKARLIKVANANEQLGDYQYQGGTIDLNRVNFGQLQNIMDGFSNSNCAHEIETACRWKVLSLVRSGPGKDGDQFAGLNAVLPTKVAAKTDRRQAKQAKAVVPATALQVTATIPTPDTSTVIAAAQQSLEVNTEIEEITEPFEPEMLASETPVSEPTATTKVVHRPAVIPTIFKQRVAVAEWKQAYSATHPSEAMQNTAELATPVTVNLAQRSQVKVFVNGVEKRREFIEAGRSELNTDALPEGSYPIAVHINNDIEGETVVEQMFGRHRLPTRTSTASYGIFYPRKETEAAVTTAFNQNDFVFNTSVRTSHSPLKSSLPVDQQPTQARIADVTLLRRGNQYQLTVNGAIGGQSAIANALKAAYLGKDLTLSINDVEFVPSNELTGNTQLASFINTGEHRSNLEPIELKDQLVLRLSPVRLQDQSTGLVESRVQFASRLRRAVGTKAASKKLSRFQFVDAIDLGQTALKVKLDAEQHVAVNDTPIDIIDLEIETPFINLG